MVITQENANAIAIIPAGVAALCDQCNAVVNLPHCPICGSETMPIYPVLNPEENDDKQKDTDMHELVGGLPIPVRPSEEIL